MRANAHLISDAYLDQLRTLHTSARGIGHSGRKHASEILAVARAISVGSILDYGCGAGTLGEALRVQSWPFRFSEYDPAVPGKDQMPQPADLVVCTDVLEHVEPERLNTVLGHIRSLSQQATFLVISTVPAHKELPDGRNAHLIVQPPNWWREQITAHRWTVKSRFIRADADGEICEVSMWLRNQT